MSKQRYNGQHSIKWTWAPCVKVKKFDPDIFKINLPPVGTDPFLFALLGGTAGPGVA